MGWDLSPLCTAATTGLLYQPQMIDGDWGAISAIKIGRGNRTIQRKPASAPLCPPHTPHDLTRARTRAAEMGSQRLTAWTMARPCPYVTSSLTRRRVCLLWIGFAFVKFTYHTYSIGLHGYGECLSSREAVSPIKVIIWNEEPLMEFEICLWEQSHICLLSSYRSLHYMLWFCSVYEI
jgi:hypothetical protein